jgi:DNA-directed RNA polymerase subunit F
MKYEIGKIYTFKDSEGAYLYKGGDPSDQNSWKSNVMSGPVASTGSGLTFAFQDEIVGGLRGALSPNLTMKEGIDLERRALDQYKEKNPLTSLGYEMGGAIAPALATFGASAPLSAAKVGTTALKAGASGAAYGAGSGEGLQDKALQAAITAPISGVAGGATTLLAKPVAKVGKTIKGAFESPIKKGEKEAVKLVKQALEYDKTNIDEAIKYVLERSGKSYSLADIGPSSRAYLDAVNVLPGPGKKTAMDFLIKRNGGALNRIKSDLTDAFGEQGSYFDTYKAIEQVRKSSGQKMYQNAFETKVPVSSELTSIMKTDVMQDALNTAYKISNAEKVKLPNLFIGKNGKLYTQKGAEVTDIDTKFLHYIKLGLDDTIYSSKRGQTPVGNVLLRANTQIKNEFLDYLDSSNPAYKSARDQWAGNSSILDALESGRNILKPSTNVDELADQITKMSQSEKLAFRNGVMNTIIDKMESSVFEEGAGRGTNLAYNIIKTPKNKKLLQLTFPQNPQGTKSFNKFISKLEDEIQVKDTANTVVGNSATVGRAEALAQIKKIVEPDDIQNLSPIGLIYGLFKSDYAGASEEASVAAANKLAKMLTETNKEALEEIRKEVAEKGFAKNILQKYIPNLGTAIGRGVVNPNPVGVATGSIAQPIAEGGSEALQQQLGLLNN